METVNRVKSRFVEMTGLRYGRLIVVGLADTTVKSGSTVWKCLCDCGNFVNVAGSDLRNGGTVSCKCKRFQGNRISRITGNVEDFRGQRVGKLVIIDRSEKRGWSAKCDCGNVCTIRTAEVLHVLGISTRNRGKSSCGCSRNYKSKNPALHAKTKLYQNYLDNARHRSLKFDINKEAFFLLVALDCHYCGAVGGNVMRPGSQTALELKYNGLDRIDNKLGYHENNVVPCCMTCNRAKNSMTYDEFISWILRLADFGSAKFGREAKSA